MAISALLFLGLSALAGAHAQQATNASIALLPEFSGLPLSGEVVGTGADGTTYVLSASGTNPGDIPFTMTVVQDATRVSEVLSLATGLGANAVCTYDSQGVGACTLVLEGAGTGTDTNAAPATTVISSTTIPLLAVPVTTAQTSSSSATQPSATSSSTTDSGAENGIGAAAGLAMIIPIVLAGFVNA